MRLLFPTLALSLILLPVASVAQEFTAENRMNVTPGGDGSFEVSGQAELWARDYWCAAGDYARRELRLPVTARIAVIEPYARGSHTVAFRPQPDARPEFRAVVMGLSIRNAGASLSVGQAYGYCADYRLRSAR
jgi:hypothetical protein